MDVNALPFAAQGTPSLPLYAIAPSGLDAFLGGLTPAQAAFLRASGFRAAAQQIVLLPGDAGVAGAVLGLGADGGPWAFGGLPLGLPEGTVWHLVLPEGHSAEEAALGFALGAYSFTRFRPARRQPARLVLPEGAERAVAAAEATWFVRDLINTPANELGPADLAEAAAAMGRGFGAKTEILQGEILARDYPTVAAVGAASDRKPHVAVLRWRGSAAKEDAPLVALCGKGVVFDSGGYDLKPASGMLRMKKDMGGAAVMSGLARMIMAADFPVRLVLRIGCVENMVAGRGMRPLDVVKTRRGLTVEIGNTDAEGRLVLCDLLAEASDEKPAFLLDAATLTGSARVALGPDLPALFCNDDAWAEALLDAGARAGDPLWRLPLWPGYDSLLDSPVAHLNNVGKDGMAGAIVAALFLRRFVSEGCSWAHLDTYCWNDRTRAGRPEGGEAHGMRAAFAAIERKLLR